MQAFLDPAVLFFVFGLCAGLLRSNLEVPHQISRFLSLYLLMALGLKGGFALATTGFTLEVLRSLALAIVLAVIVPLLSFFTLKRLLNGFDAAAIAATYGSVSAVTFITATQYLDQHGLPYGGHMAAAMALMESPAIILAVFFANAIRAQQAQANAQSTRAPLRKILHESLTDGAQLLIVGAMLIGFITGAKGQAAMQVFSVDLFKGMLAFFLLDMGLLAARNLPKLKGVSAWLLLYGIAAPILHAGIALVLCSVFEVETYNAALLMILSASASYIAVPAVLRHAIPEANPTLYFGLSLGLTFPLNILLGIPCYIWIAQRFLPG
jgi:uncharacterized protein